MRYRLQYRHVREGFTLVEMLVSMALIMFIMVILSQCFVTALETFRQLKGIGDMQYNLRTVKDILRADLAQDHFEGKKRLSDPIMIAERPREGFFFMRIGPNLLEGVDADNLPSFVSPQSTISSPDLLYFTIKLRGNRRENFLTHRLPVTPSPTPNAWPRPFGTAAGQFAPPDVPFFGLSPLTDPQYPRQQANGAPPAIGLPNFFAQPPDAIFQDDGKQLLVCSQWAEVAWYLVRAGSTEEQAVPGSTLGTPLYSLYRAQYLLIPNNGPANQNPDPKDSTGAAVAAAYSSTLKETTESKYGASAYSGVSCFANPAAPAPGYLYFNSPADVVTPAKRALVARGEPVTGALAPTTPALSSALVLNNVISFHVRIMPNGFSSFVDFYHPAIPPFAAPDPAPVAATFDTSTPPPPGGPNPLGNGVRALQIIIRIWDPASQQSRQVTIVQDM